jgi:hypothetical protein
MRGLRPPGLRHEEPRHRGRTGSQDVPDHDLPLREARPRPLLQRRGDVLDGVRGWAWRGAAGVNCDGIGGGRRCAGTNASRTSSGAPFSRRPRSPDRRISREATREGGDPERSPRWAQRYAAPAEDLDGASRGTRRPATARLWSGSRLGFADHGSRRPSRGIAETSVARTCVVAGHPRCRESRLNGRCPCRRSAERPVDLGRRA